MQNNELYLFLFHGRIDPNQDMENMGEQGPVLGPFNFIHNTYGHIRLVRNEDGEEFDLEWHEDMVKFQDMYYGDFTVGAVSSLSDTDRSNMLDPFQDKFRGKKITQATPGHRPQYKLRIAYGSELVDAIELLEDMNSSFKLDMRDMDDGEIYYHEFHTEEARVAYVLGVTESAGYDNAFKVISEKVNKQIIPR